MPLPLFVSPAGLANCALRNVCGAAHLPSAAVHRQPPLHASLRRAPFFLARATDTSAVEKSAAEDVPQSARGFRLPPGVGLLALAVAVGAATGSSVTAFKSAIDQVQTYLYGDVVAGALFDRLGQYTLAVIPPLGGLAVTCFRLASGKEFVGGLGAILDEIANSRPTPVVAPLVKIFAAIATLGSGCSLGPEQSAVDIGATLSRWVGQVFIIDPEKQRILLAAGAASGLAAGFNAPVAGCFFAIERLGESAAGVSAGGTEAAVVLLSAAISSLIVQTGLGATPAFQLPVYDLQNPLLELPLWLTLGACAGLVSSTFRWLLRACSDLFASDAVTKFVSREFMPLLAGLFCGLVALVYPQILFFGYDTLSALLADTEYSIELLLTLLFVKGVSTAICLASGLVGGTVAPSLFLGAVLGASFEKIASHLLSHSVLLKVLPTFAIAGAPAYSLVGATAVLAGQLRAPLTASLLLFELTRDYRLIIPLIAAAGISSWISNDGPLSRTRVTSVSPAHLRTDTVALDDVSETPTDPQRADKRNALELGEPLLKGAQDNTSDLTGITLADAILLSNITTLPADMSVTEALDQLVQCGATIAIVEPLPDARTQQVGILTAQDILADRMSSAAGGYNRSERVEPASVGGIASRGVACFRGDAPVSSVLLELHRPGVEHVVAFLAEDRGDEVGKPFGIVTLASIEIARQRALLKQSAEISARCKQ